MGRVRAGRRRVLLDGLRFPECPRWHEGAFWFSEIHAHRVVAVDPGGRARVVAELPTRPSGLGFLPDGTPLVVAMRRPRALLALRGGAPELVVDLESLPGDFLNDMLVDPQGRAYIGFRSDRLGPDAPVGPEGLVRVDPDGSFEVVAEGLAGPNGTVLSPDGRVLTVAETHGRRLTSFSVLEDGRLGPPRPFADTGDALPDGICLDAEGAIWIPAGPEFRRIAAGGGLLERVAVGEGLHATACALGGEDRRTLLMASHVWEPRLGAMVDPTEDLRSPVRGRIEVVEVTVPGAGLP
ncbi:MAG TPA: SMP-30/gluconolactonase/LRE family protein [Candidatus Dormibacteraeota bacterium]|jgi:sugar lactone lactonase YvrE|nr:SMP-30/gluconolactonase/LRE family protein [Candidatus Dormibacteraeota bacterium]